MEVKKMSTRSQIEFKNIWKDKKKKEHSSSRTVYRHSDGYPEGVIPDLKAFLKWNEGRNGDVEYQTANFIYWSKRKHEELYWNKDYTGKIEDPKAKWDDCNPTETRELSSTFTSSEMSCFNSSSSPQ